MKAFCKVKGSFEFAQYGQEEIDMTFVRVDHEKNSRIDVWFRAGDKALCLNRYDLLQALSALELSEAVEFKP